MKKSTVKLILLTIIGIIISFICYNMLDDVQLSIPNSRSAEKLHLLCYIAPFIGVFYWLFLRNFDE